MNKLPHERLREFADSVGCKGCNHLASMAGSGCDEFDTCTDCINAVATAIADEIEKYYDPKLRFEDGKPAKEGDKYVDKLGNECTISSIKIHARIWDENGKHEAVDVRKPLKRPESKALDADGVEINAGDTVWDIDSGEKLTVVEFANREHGLIQCSHADDGDCDDFNAYRLTHREPDSLKKAVDDLGELLNFPMCDDIKLDKVEEVYNRLTAIMERDA